MRLREILELKGIRQKDVAAAIGIKQSTFNNYCTGFRDPPLDVVRDIADYLGVSVDYLLGGEEKRQITKKPSTDVMLVPVVGEISAGNPHIMEEDIIMYMPMPRKGSEDDWLCLRIDGDSMDQAGLPPGSVAVFRRSPIADDGKVVAAAIGDVSTVKRFYRDGDTVLLMPQSSNPEHRMQRYSLKTDDFRILGVLYSVMTFADGAP